MRQRWDNSPLLEFGVTALSLSYKLYHGTAAPLYIAMLNQSIQFPNDYIIFITIKC